MSVQLLINENPSVYKQRIFDFISTFPDAVFLDSNKDSETPIAFTGTRYSFIAAAGVNAFADSHISDFNNLQQFIDACKARKEWIFGFLSYDLKNIFEKLESGNPEAIEFPLFHFFSAKHIFIADNNSLTVIDSADPENLWQSVKRFIKVKDSEEQKPAIRVSHVLNRDNYLLSVKNLINHIQRGDIYEINYCHQLILQTKHLNAAALFGRISEISPGPFSCYYVSGGLHLICSSPERFLSRNKNLLITQPVKGTAARSENAATDELNRSKLAESRKERSENIMIVDLVRNDLSRVAKKGTVKVEELCGIYSFPKVHQMISTVSCMVDEETKFTDIISALFPMGSMTGAPKISAMKLIESEENFKRSLFSGSVGYIDPAGDFDFNVVIRSILYSDHTGVATVAAGGAITAGSIPEEEYAETLLKLSPQLTALGLSSEIFLKQFSNDIF